MFDRIINDEILFLFCYSIFFFFFNNRVVQNIMLDTTCEVFMFIEELKNMDHC